MRSTIFTATLVASLAPLALATIFITEPVAVTVCSAGVVCNVDWNDDGNVPTLATIGPASIGLFVGSQQTQTLVQDITDSVDVSQQNNVQWTPNAANGPNDAIYFIRFTSLGYKDPSNNNYAYESFSAKFTLNGMTGSFNSTVLSEIGAATSVPASVAPTVSVTGSTPVSTGSTTPTVSGSPTGSSISKSVSSTAKGSSVSSSAKPSGSTTPNGASKLTGGAAMAAVAVVASAALAWAF